MRILLPLTASLALLASLTACDGGDTGAGGSAGNSTCGTLSSPKLFTLADVQPAAGSSVPNDGIVHSFTLQGAPGLLQSITLLMPEGKHTAGAGDPAQWSFQISPSGSDYHYEAAPVTWQTAPGDVYVQVSGVFQDASGCVFAFPDPLFSYSVTPAGTGGAGTGGAGTGGAGTGGAGTGGAGTGGGQ